MTRAAKAGVYRAVLDDPNECREGQGIDNDVVHNDVLEGSNSNAVIPLTSFI